MLVVIRSEAGGLQRSLSFSVSAAIHCYILVWLGLSGLAPAEPPMSVYDREIRPFEKKIIWFSPHDRLPDVSPAENRHDARLPRAREKFNQNIVAGAKDDRHSQQMIYMPAPEIHPPEPVPLPNVVAVATPPPKPLRAFTPPAPKPPAPSPAVVPDAPNVTQVVDTKNVSLPTSKAPARAFTPPPTKAPKTDPVTLLDAPAVSAKVEDKGLGLALANPRAPLRSFTPPPAAKAKVAAAPVPDAPSVEAAVGNRSLPLAVADPRAPLRSFTPPPQPGRTPAAREEALPAAPSVESGPSAAPVASLAIVGMNPSKAPEFVTPPGSRPGSFSAGPEERTEGREAAGGSTLVVPGLLTRGGLKEERPTMVADLAPSSKNLMAGARAALGAPRPAPAENLATRVSNAPDPRLEGRAVYTMAIQMPNITSYSGSWLVWFAEHESLAGSPAGQVKAPVPVRKVDPKYVAAAVTEKVEGTVRLFAIIRKDGHVDSVAVLRHLDSRLDSTAAEALAKWEFEPAQRDGAPMDVDAVFEIPFRLAPKPTR